MASGVAVKLGGNCTSSGPSLPASASGSIPALNSSTSACRTAPAWSSQAASASGAAAAAASRNIAGCVNFWYSFTANSNPGGVRSAHFAVTCGRGWP